MGLGVSTAMKSGLCVLKVNESNGMKSKAFDSSHGSTDLPNDACTFYIRLAAGQVDSMLCKTRDFLQSSSSNLVSN